MVIMKCNIIRFNPHQIRNKIAVIFSLVFYYFLFNQDFYLEMYFFNWFTPIESLNQTLLIIVGLFECCKNVKETCPLQTNGLIKSRF